MLEEFIEGLFVFIAYFGIAASLVFTVKLLLKPRREIVRKLMHTVCFLSIFVLMEAFETWYLAAATSILFALIIYPLLYFAEKHPKYASLFNQRRSGEVRESLMLVFLMMAFMVSVFWGIHGEEWKFIIITAVTAWGFGDASAALAGKKYGKHCVQSKFVENCKTWEGTFAMYMVSTIVIFSSLYFYSNLIWYVDLLVAMVVAAFSALSELVSHQGKDTITVPLATALPLFALMYVIVNSGIV